MSRKHREAWKMVDGLVDNCKELYPHEVRSIILTGSLAGGSYQPGLSDVDVLTVLDDRTPNKTKTDIFGLCHQFSSDYSIQVDPIILRHSDFLPPWSNNLCIQPEILRLKTSGRVLHGQNIIENLPIPTKRQMWEFDLSLREWTLKVNPPNWRYWTLKESLRIILEQAMTYFYYKTGIALYNKHHIANLFFHHFPHFNHLSMLEFASHLWRNYPHEEDELPGIQIAEQARDIYNYITLSLGFDRRHLIN